jgi:hypothetical protein
VQVTPGNWFPQPDGNELVVRSQEVFPFRTTLFSQPWLIATVSGNGQVVISQVAKISSIVGWGGENQKASILGSVKIPAG